MNRHFKKAGYVGSLIITVLLAFMLSFSVCAWLVNYLPGVSFGFRSGELDELRLDIARITHSAEAEADESSRTYAECRNDRIEANEDGSHLDVNIDNMSFGTIDNVSQLKAENIVYLRLTVPKSAGNTVKLHLNYSDENFIVLYKNTYDIDGNVIGTEQVTDSVLLSNLIGVESAEEADDAFLLYSCVVSNEAYEANEIAVRAGFAADEKDYKRFQTAGMGSENIVTLRNTNYASVPEGGNYYIYIKVIPNLPVFAHSIEYIADVMPCYMYFKLMASFEAMFIS